MFDYRRKQEQARMAQVVKALRKDAREPANRAERRALGFTRGRTLTPSVIEQEDEVDIYEPTPLATFKHDHGY